jgi:hypothetical protein
VASAQTPTWRAEFLGPAPVGLTTMFPVAVNDVGQVVGIGYVAGWKRAWVAGPGQVPTILPLPDGANDSVASDINAAGIIAGQVLHQITGSQGVLWRPGPGGHEVFLMPSGPDGTVPFSLTGLNDAGDVVGKYGIFSNAYAWNETMGFTLLPYSVFPVVPGDINEQRQIVGNTSRMDIDTMQLEELGNPTGTTYGYQYTVLSNLDDAGACTGYAVTATSSLPYLPVRYTDGPTWKVFSNFPLNAAGAAGIAATGDTVFQLGTYGTYIYVNGFGSIALQSTLDPSSAGWDLTGSFVPAIGRGGLLACTGSNASTAEGGLVLLTPVGFDDLGGASAGALGTPVLSGYGTLLSDTPARVRLASAAPGSPAYGLASLTSEPLPFQGGTLHANPFVLVRLFFTEALGRLDLTFNWPPLPVGTSVYLQFGVADPDAMTGVAMSNAVVGVTQ